MTAAPAGNVVLLPRKIRVIKGSDGGTMGWRADVLVKKNTVRR